MSEDATLRLQRALEIDDRVINLARVPPPDLAGAEAALRDGADLDARISRGQTLLGRACLYGRADLVRWLLGHGAGPGIADGGGWTPLAYAVWKNDVDIAAMVLECLGDARCLDAPIPGPTGETPLMMACERGQIGLARWLLGHGAGLERTDVRGWTPLIHAARDNHGDVVAMLLAQGANPNARGLDGATVLMMVATALFRVKMDADSRLMGDLLDAGANPSLVDADGYTAPERFAGRERRDLLMALDAALAHPAHANHRGHVLERLTPEKRIAWLPRSAVLEAVMPGARAVRRTP